MTCPSEALVRLLPWMIHAAQHESKVSKSVGPRTGMCGWSCCCSWPCSPHLAVAMGLWVDVGAVSHGLALHSCQLQWDGWPMLQSRAMGLMLMLFSHGPACHIDQLQWGLCNCH
jgi:hypothetical protein